ncbi:hypothetical protein CLAFUW4_04361 [Fulvia fulva]|uniref:Class I hydrophobin 1 n=1 Tax=Passalora fulva TaxID=5499 RepID=HCF1_PASFU|nr:uncharacterized protein CLAFUR5_04324 [Fulvia fulva]KAK4626709.1 hypothetical protein CLAFUR4_04347 [Fulvia fulva]KAK4628610.1 hypothetical protein CLAFUR0_04348 [Fulvia fulva]UJO16371.1 hypothetical protein CLAFUR5_04324 [Fulvia fulva]WPV13789.1 hypothetical protein CLAFUW4_04361 [Fulvia fulva]WPV28453.1 hypothetical protein CLAFUW7_04350 [Fulvia fulva]
MQFTSFAILAISAVASARVTRRDDSSATGADKGGTCAVGSQISCCTTNSSGSDILGNVLGGSCLLDNVSLISSLNSNCPAGNTFCCPSNQDGTLNINVSCIPVSA